MFSFVSLMKFCVCVKRVGFACLCEVVVHALVRMYHHRYEPEGKLLLKLRGYHILWHVCCNQGTPKLQSTGFCEGKQKHGVIWEVASAVLCHSLPRKCKAAVCVCSQEIYFT